MSDDRSGAPPSGWTVYSSFNDRRATAAAPASAAAPAARAARPTGAFSSGLAAILAKRKKATPAAAPLTAPPAVPPTASAALLAKFEAQSAADFRAAVLSGAESSDTIRHVFASAASTSTSTSTLSAVQRCAAESDRLDRMWRVRRRFDALVAAAGLRGNRESLTRWVLEQLSESPGADPILPTQLQARPAGAAATVESAETPAVYGRYSYCDSLVVELTEATTAAAATAGSTFVVPADLGDRCRTVCRQVAAIADAHAVAVAAAIAAGASASGSSSGGVAVTATGDTVRLELRGSRHDMLATHYAKLLSLASFHRRSTASGSIEASGDDTSSGEDAATVFSVLQRYRTAAGVRPNEGSGHHAAVPGAVLDAMAEHLGVRMECFASPLNSHFPYFCSAFPDTDGAFGSVGSFFNFRPTEGSFEVNPPFVESVMQSMQSHIEALLTSGAAGALCFVIVIPDWSEPMTPCIERLYRDDKRVLSRAMALDEGRHCYLDGFQHCLREALFRPVHKTLMFVLQNAAGRARWPVAKEGGACEKVAEAWAAIAEGMPTAAEAAAERKRQRAD